MSQLSTAGRLFQSLSSKSTAIRDAVAHAAGIPPERADGAMAGSVRLSLAEQLRLSEATMVLSPEHKREALRLRGQALAARSFESGNLVDRHSEAPVQRWEASSTLR
jgi:hypothetical protein